MKNFSPIPVPLKEMDNYEMHLDLIRDELARGMSALLTSTLEIQLETVSLGISCRNCIACVVKSV